MKITPRNRFFTHALLAAAVTLLAAAPTAQAARAKKQAAPAPVLTEPTSPYLLEIGADFNSAVNDIYENIGKINTVGADITGVYQKDEHHAYTLRLGFGYGSGETHGGDQEWDVTHVCLMPGYRYTAPLSDKSSYFVGANLGVVHQSVKFTDKDDEGSESWSGNSIGFGYSAEIGVQYKWSEKVTLLAAYQLSGSTNQTEFDIFDDEKIKCKQQMYNTFRFGVSVKF